jgi:hypothetical protein
MKNSISDITYYENDRGLRWIHGTRHVERLFPTPVKAVALQDGTGLLVVEPASDDAPNNAIIINCDGSVRTRVNNPEKDNGAICFGDAYYVQDELTLIICFSAWQMACVIDESGNVVRTYESR